MKTDELILQLAKSALPVTPLPSPFVRLLRWLALAAALAAVAVLAIGPRADLAVAVTRPTFVVSLLALVVATLSSAAAAFVLSVPGAGRSSLQRALAVAATLAWPLVWFLVLANAGAGRGRLFHAGCALEIAILSAVSGGALIAMLRRAAPLQPAWTGGIAATAAVTVASAATQVICPIDTAPHQLVGHILIASIVGSAGFLVGWPQLRRRTRI
ncbi:MAG: NrsF family protein [Acidobacteriota bacterium]